MLRSFGIALLLLWPGIARANVAVCVEVTLKSWSAPPEPVKAKAPRPAPAAPAPAAAPAEARPPDAPFDPIRDFYNVPATESESAKPPSPPRRDPHRLDPARYLKRLLEYEVTHAEGFVAVERGCTARMEVELYSLARGWTMFARFSQTGREEKVDRVELDEFEALAERVALALLFDLPITDTVTRENVLRADSARAARTIRGRGHAAFALGSSVRVGELATAQTPAEPVVDDLQVLTPFVVQLGYRLKLGSFGLDAFSRFNIRTDNTALASNPTGGHVDYAGSAALGLHFLRFLDAVGVGALYVGGGAAIELSLFDVIRPVGRRTESDRSYLVGGGLNVDLFVGYEFMRASAVHFFGQLEAIVPTYVFDTENSSGAVRTYFPGGLVQLGVIL